MPGVPLPPGGRCFGHVASGLQLFEGPFSTSRQLRVALVGQPARAANEVSHTGVDRVLDSWRGHLPDHLAKGKRPQDRVGVSLR